MLPGDQMWPMQGWRASLLGWRRSVNPLTSIQEAEPAESLWSELKGLGGGGGQ